MTFSRVLLAVYSSASSVTWASSSPNGCDGSLACDCANELLGNDSGGGKGVPATFCGKGEDVCDAEEALVEVVEGEREKVWPPRIELD